MTEERIVGSILMSAALVLGVAGCPPEPPDADDAGVTGGRATGGSATSGRATGGTASLSVCATVESLPAIGTTCNTWGESQCDPSGNRCVCERYLWYCNTSCASTYPTEPTPDSACIRGAACHYPSGVSCQCYNLRWVCIGTGGCPADAPMTGDPCDGLNGVLCDYPNADLHVMCVCMANADPSTGSTWTCIESDVCPTTQPAYDLNQTCLGTAMCSYGSTRCGCRTQSPWICGFGLGIF